MRNKLMSMVERVNSKVYIPLHCHNTYSQLDGYGTAEQHSARAKEMGLTHLASTNHNHLAGITEFQSACEKDGIFPILGCEIYYTENNSILALEKKDRDRIAKEKAEKDGIEIPKKITKKELNKILEPYSYDTKQYHLLLIAKNQKGWKNLVKIQSYAAEQCTFNGRYLADNELLSKYAEDVICTTACLGSYPAQRIVEGNIQEAERIIDEWHDIFKDNFYLEIQPLLDPEQVVVNEYYMKWSKEKNIKLVATNDVHYPKKEDNIIHDVLLCIGIGREYHDKDRMRYDHEFWIKSYDEMIEGFINQIEKHQIENPEEYFKNCIDALATTEEIANQIEEIQLGSPVPLFPKVKLPEGLNADETLELESFQRLYKYANKKKMTEDEINIYEKRLKSELEVIKKKQYSPYFLAVEDFISAAHELGCSTGPSRGSAAGSFTSFINDIVKVTDPVEHNLLFFRFLTEDRTSPPDYLMF